ncbi:hypothetical protein ABTZ99_35315 [Actinosynnema sp. NPDC002837]
MRRTWGAVPALVSVISAVPAAAGTGYVELAVLPGGTTGSAVDVNDSGVVVGRSTNAEGRSRPVRWDAGGRLTELTPPAGATPGKVFGVDADGAAYGNTSTADRNSQATRWNPDGSTTVFDIPPGDTCSFAVAVNDSGTVVGYSGDYATGVRRAVRWDRDGTATALPGLAPATEATAIDEAGAIAGTATTADDLVHYVRWDDGALTVLGVVPDATYSSVADVNGRYVVAELNDRGAAAGTAISRYNRPIRWSPSGEVALLPVPSGTYDFAQGINDRGVVVGEYGGRPVLWP